MLSIIAMALSDIGGVGGHKVLALRGAGYYNKDYLKEATQSELAEIDEISNALAARIKAVVGDNEEENCGDDSASTWFGSVDTFDPITTNASFTLKAGHTNEEKALFHALKASRRMAEDEDYEHAVQVARAASDYYEEQNND